MFNENAEVRLASCLLGTLVILWACIMRFPEPSFSMLFALISTSVLRWLAFFMGLQGLLLIIGAVIPIRKLRQVGLVFTCICWFALFGVFLDIWVITITTLMVGVFGFFTLMVLVIDVKRKPRCKMLPD